MTPTRYLEVADNLTEHHRDSSGLFINDRKTGTGGRVVLYLRSCLEAYKVHNQESIKNITGIASSWFIN